jgi:hypothetical protein
MEGGCYRHPDREALYECVACGRPICDDCMIFGDEEGDVRCPACSLDTAASVVMEDEERIERERKGGRKKVVERGKAIRARTAVNRGLLALFVALAAVAVGITVYLDIGVEPINLASEDLGRFKNPALEMIVLASKVHLYASEHGGRLPAGLADLVPDYLDARPRVLKGDVDYDYRTDAAKKFLISCPQPAKYHYRALSINGLGDLVVE